MTGSEFKVVCDFEGNLTVGQEVVVRWTNCGSRFAARGTICKINAKSVRVRLTEEVPTGYSEPYPVGREIIVPKMNNVRDWSVNNRIEPTDGYQPVA